MTTAGDPSRHLTLDEPSVELLQLARDLCAALACFLVTPEGDVTVALPPEGARAETRDRVSALARSSLVHPDAFGTEIFTTFEPASSERPGVTRMLCKVLTVRDPGGSETEHIGLLGIVDTAPLNIDDELRFGLSRIASRLASRLAYSRRYAPDSAGSPGELAGQQEPVQQHAPDVSLPQPLYGHELVEPAAIIPATTGSKLEPPPPSAIEPEPEPAPEPASPPMGAGPATARGGTFLEEVIAHTPDPILVVREDGTVLYASETLSSVLGNGDAANILGREITDLIDPFDPIFAEGHPPAELVKMLAGQPPPGRRVKMFHGETTDVQVDICGTELPSSHLGRCYVASLRVAGEGSPAGSQARDELRTSRSVIDALEDGLVACDSHGIVVLANPPALSLQGLPAGSELLGRPFPQNTSLLASDGTRISAAEHPLTRAIGGATVRNEQLQLPREKGGPRWITASAQPLDIGDAAPGALLLLHDSSPQREHEAWLTRLALYDPLTGVANRSLLLDHLTRALVRSRREGGRAGLLFCDLDGLKLVNDTYGHDVGDEVLTAVARRLEGVLRPSDTVARLGGDEFAAVAYSSSPDPTELDAVMRRVRTVLSDPYQVRNQTISVLVTLGSVMADGRTDDATSVLVRADRELYQMKTLRMQSYAD